MRRGGLAQLLEEGRGAFEGLAGELDLTTRERLDALDRELIGLGEGFDILALAAITASTLKPGKEKAEKALVTS